LELRRNRAGHHNGGVSCFNQCLNRSWGCRWKKMVTVTEAAFTLTKVRQCGCGPRQEYTFLLRLMVNIIIMMIIKRYTKFTYHYTQPQQSGSSSCYSTPNGGTSQVLSHFLCSPHWREWPCLSLVQRRIQWWPSQLHPAPAVCTPP